MARFGRYVLVGSVLVVLFFSGPSSGSAPDPAEADEAAIRHLEARESAAVLAQDFETLAQIWSERFIVNTPRNIVAPDRSVVVDVFRQGLAHYTAFERRIEHFHLDADIAIVMGGETVRPAGRAPRAGETIERRFTHLWKREDEGWRLYARHANIIPPPTEVQRAAVDGAELHYIATGSGDPVVLIHGSLADYGYWEYSNQVAPLAAEHRVIAYSRRYNHPNLNPTGPPDHSAVIEAQDLAGFLDQLGLERVHLVGHSYGAYTALLFALDHPERVRSLVLAEPPILSWLPGIPGGEGIEEGFMSQVWAPLADAFTARGDEAGLDFTAQWYFGVPFVEVTPEWQVLFTNNVHEWRALATSQRAFPRPDPERVRALHVPTLLLSGGKNAGGFNDLIDGQLERLLPNARRIVIPDASHEMFLDFPELTAQTMLEFFRHTP